LQGAANGVESVAELFDGGPDALLSILADALCGSGVVEDVGDGGLRNVGSAGHVLDGRPRGKRGSHGGVMGYGKGAGVKKAKVL